MVMSGPGPNNGAQMAYTTQQQPYPIVIMSQGAAGNQQQPMYLVPAQLPYHQQSSALITK